MANLRFLLLGRRRLHGLGGLGMATFLLGQIAQELTDAGVGGPAGGLFVEALRLQLHQFRLFANRRQPQRAYQPDRLSRDKALDVLPPDKRNVIAITLSIEIEQAMTMAVLLHAQLLELRRLRWEIGLQALGKVLVNPGVFFL